LRELHSWGRLAVMDKSKTTTPSLQIEVMPVLEFLAAGPVLSKATSKIGFLLSRKNGAEHRVSVKTLAYMARKGWVSRDGQTISITDKAPLANKAVNRETTTNTLMENGQMRIVTRVSSECPIDYLASRKDKNGVPMLGAAEWSAGDRLRADFTRANMLPSIGMRWGEPLRGSGLPGGGTTLTDAALAARLRVTKAMEAVGPEFSGLLLDVCCFLKGLEQVEMERSWPQRSAKVMLKAGLSILARHYNPVKNTTTKTRSWGTEDYRPSL
ncbi:MAG: DUF6456 domain-containing protein, partial [Notoacmeibacter sp.]